MAFNLKKKVMIRVVFTQNSDIVMKVDTRSYANVRDKTKGR